MKVPCLFFGQDQRSPSGLSRVDKVIPPCVHSALEHRFAPLPSSHCRHLLSMNLERLTCRNHVELVGIVMYAHLNVFSCHRHRTVVLSSQLEKISPPLVRILGRAVGPARQLLATGVCLVLVVSDRLARLKISQSPLDRGF